MTATLTAIGVGVLIAIFAIIAAGLDAEEERKKTTIKARPYWEPLTSEDHMQLIREHNPDEYDRTIGEERYVLSERLNADGMRFMAHMRKINLN